MMINLQAAWISFLMGCLSGAGLGLFFARPDWLGGYGSWRRRMLRLGHISFFGLGFINLAWALTVRTLAWDDAPALVSYLFLAGGVLMPLVCFLAAWRNGFRLLFALPVCAVTAGIGLSIVKVVSL